MKFVVSRVSTRGSDIEPCEGAKIEKLTWLDVRTIRTIEEAKTCPWFNKWFERGVNHREENGYVVCDSIVPENEWVIELNSIEELESFVKKHGDVIISECSYKEIKIELKIYDDYIE